MTSGCGRKRKAARNSIEERRCAGDKKRAHTPKMPADEEAKTAVLQQQLDDEDRYSPRASDAGVSVLEREFLPGCVTL